MAARPAGLGAQPRKTQRPIGRWKQAYDRRARMNVIALE